MVIIRINIPNYNVDQNDFLNKLKYYKENVLNVINGYVIILESI
jgi:hypothetical protein